MAKRKSTRSKADLLGDDDTPTQKEIAANLDRLAREPREGNGTFVYPQVFPDDEDFEFLLRLCRRDRQSFVVWWTKKGWKIGVPIEDAGRLAEHIETMEGAK